MHENIRLNIATTLLVGLLSTLVLILFGSPFSTGVSGITHGGAPVGSLIVSAPIFFAIAAALFQYHSIMRPWNKALGELVSKALNLQSIPNPQSVPTPAPVGADQLSLLRSSIEFAAVQFKDAHDRERMLVQHAVDVICIIDLKSTILSVNPASRSVWGYAPDELVGRQITDYLVSDDVKATMKSLLAAEKSIEKIVFENRFRKKSGEVVDLLWSAHLSASDRGLFCIAHDITERKRAEQMLRESEERVRRILEGLPAGVAVIGVDGQIEFLNQTAMDLTGYSATDMKTLKAATLFSFIKGTEPVGAEVANLDASFDCQVLKHTGERLPAEASTRSIAWGKGKAVLVIFLDATLKVEIETAKREFVAMVSHDLRTPLTTISLIFAYLQDGLGGTLSEDGVEFARKGNDSCQRLITLVQDLLDLEKMRAGKFAMDMVETPIKEVIDAAVSAVEPYAQSQGIRIVADCADELKCYCDGGRVIQVLINLVGNAVKFSVTDGEVLVAVREGTNNLTLSVSNRGRTIPQEKLASIFEKFEQANARAAEERKGTGLGLAISKTIVEQHNGRIWAESSDADGTKFSFTLPRFAS